MPFTPARSFVERSNRCGLRRVLRTFARDDHGSVAMIAAVVFPIVIGGMGLGAEAGHWYVRERTLQHAADVSAYGAAIRLREGEDGAALDTVGLNLASSSGFKPSSGSIEVNHPPVSGPHAGNVDMVEVALTEDIDRAFSSFFMGGDVKVHARAVASVDAALYPACLIALAGSGAQTLSVTGNGTITLNSCVAAANSSDPQGVFVKGSGALEAKCTFSKDGFAYAQKTSSIVSECEPEVQDATVVDPYPNIELPPPFNSCYTAGKKDPAIPAAPTRTEGTLKIWDLCGLAITENLNLQPGLYVIHGGDITDTGQPKVTGTGVTFFLTNKPGSSTVFSRINVNGTKFDLKAPTTGAYSGLLFFGEDVNTGTQEFGGNSDLQAQGALHFPGGTIDFGGGSGSGGCVQLVADKITFTGNGDITFAHNCTGAGTTTATAGAAGTVRLAE